MGVKRGYERVGADVARLVQAGGNLAGTAVGSYLTLVSGDPIGSALVGAGLTSVIGEVAERTLSSRQQQRVGAVIEYAAAALISRETLGEQLREDGFWEGERSTGEEITEGVLLAARDEHEERKLPYIGNLLASVALHSEIDPATANHLIRLSHSLSWMELRVLAIVADSDRWPMPERPPTLDDNLEWSVWTVHNTLSRLRNERGFIAAVHTKTERMGLSIPDLRLSFVHPSDLGNLVAMAMQLDRIPTFELRDIHAALIRDGAAPSESSSDEPLEPTGSSS